MGQIILLIPDDGPPHGRRGAGLAPPTARYLQTLCFPLFLSPAQLLSPLSGMSMRFPSEATMCVFPTGNCSNCEPHLLQTTATATLGALLARLRRADRFAPKERSVRPFKDLLRARTAWRRNGNRGVAGPTAEQGPASYSPTTFRKKCS